MKSVDKIIREWREEQESGSGMKLGDARAQFRRGIHYLNNLPTKLDQDDNLDRNVQNPIASSALPRPSPDCS